MKPVAQGKIRSNLLIGVVSYCSDILKIWDGMRASLLARGVDLDYVTYTNYERQVTALLHGHIDVAWNGPLAHIRLQRRAGHKGRTVSLGMRDVDRDFQSYLVTRKADAAKFKSLKDVESKQVFAGTHDSPQAYILPLHFLKQAKVNLGTIDLIRFDRDVGKHGDTADGEVEVLKAVLGETSKPTYGVVSKLMFDRLDRKAELEIVHNFQPFDHCQFDCMVTLPESTRKAFQEALFAMNGSTDLKDKEVMRLEGIRERWEQPRESGYDSMRAALASDPLVEFPSPIHTPDSHPFRSLTIQ